MSQMLEKVARYCSLTAHGLFNIKNSINLGEIKALDEKSY